MIDKLGNMLKMPPSILQFPFHLIGLIRFMLGLYLAIPLGFVLGTIQKPTHRLTFILVTSLCIHYFIFGICYFYSSYTFLDVSLSLLHLIACYFLIVCINRKRVGCVVTIFSLTYLGATHIIRMMLDYGSWNITVVTLLMIETVFLSTFAWEYQDGEMGREKNKKAIVELPNFAEFMAAGLCFTQSLAGPCSSFVGFADFIYKRGDFKEIPKENRWECAKRVLTSVAWTVVYIALAKLYPIDRLSSFENSLYDCSGFYRV